MKRIKKIFKWLFISTITVCFIYYAFIFVFFYDNIQYKQIGNTNFYLMPNAQGEELFLYHDGGEEEDSKYITDKNHFEQIPPQDYWTRLG